MGAKVFWVTFHVIALELGGLILYGVKVYFIFDITMDAGGNLFFESCQKKKVLIPFRAVRILHRTEGIK